MGFLKEFANRVLDEVSTLSPTLGELRWEQLKKEYEHEKEKETEDYFGSSSKSSNKKR